MTDSSAAQPPFGRLDEQAVLAARNGSREHLRLLWLQHSPWVAAVLLAHKPASVELDDLIQEVAVQLVSRLSDLREPHLFCGWLRTLAINIARDSGRQQQRRPMLRLTDNGLTIPDGFAAPPDLQELNEHAARVLATAESLPAEYSEPLLLRAVRGLKPAHIADLLGLPESVVYQRISRARRMVREAMERSDIDENERSEVDQRHAKARSTSGVLRHDHSAQRT